MYESLYNLAVSFAVMAELADAHGSGPCEATHGGSNPFDRTIKYFETVWNSAEVLNLSGF